MTKLSALRQEVRNLADSKQAKILQRFFKTGKGEYGEGDVFLGIKVAGQRKIAKKYKDLDLKGIEKLLNSKIHEERVIALFILIEQYEKADDSLKTKFYEFYLKNTEKINNWDLVDLSAPKIMGDYLLNRPRDILYKFAKSENLWEKRIAILSTYIFIRNNQFADTLAISEILLNDTHDLIHKAVGWMLREVGKRNQIIEEEFLNKHYKTMPRTMLRYAIERFDKKKKKFYMRK